MSSVKVELNYAGVGQLLHSSEMQAILESHASRIATKAGKDCEVYVAPTRAVAEVRTTSKNGNQDNKLLKAVRG